jgi:hypothetical protein
MEFFDQLNKFMKTILIVTALVIMYGYLCRYAGIYFFWESSYIGWLLLYTVFIGLLWQRIKMKRMIRKKPLPEKIAIGIIIFVLFIKGTLLFATPFSDAYVVAKKYLLADSAIRNEVGTIHSFSIVPEGSINTSKENDKHTGSAEITLIVKGEMKFKQVTVYLVKHDDQQEWVAGGAE